MKKTILIIAVLVLVACGTETHTNHQTADTTNTMVPVYDSNGEEVSNDKD